MIRYSVSQRTKTLWFYAEANSIKLSQHKLKEHFNVAWASRKPTIMSLVDKFLTNGSEMLDILILTFWRSIFDPPYRLTRPDFVHHFSPRKPVL